MPFYENVFVARQDLTPAKVNELTYLKYRDFRALRINELFVSPPNAILLRTSAPHWLAIECRPSVELGFTLIKSKKYGR